MRKNAIFQFLRVENRNTFHGQKLTVFCKFRIFPLFLDIYTPWEKYDILKNHTGSGFENCSGFGLIFSHFCLLFRRMSEIPLIFTENTQIFFMACLHIALSIFNFFKPQKIWKNIFFSQNVKKITFSWISGTGAICLPMV